MASVGEDIAREILLRLPTEDLARCSCVCKLWRDVVRDPSFCTLHGNSRHVISTSGAAEAETLLVQEFRGRGDGINMTVLRVTSSKPMSRFTELADGYRPANACNGFLLLASSVHDWPLYVCNPITGEQLTIPAPPEIKHVERRAYAIGFSSSTRQYKLFCLSFPRTGWPETHENYVDVCTLGVDDGGWRRNRGLFRAVYLQHPPPPVLMDGKLYVVIEPPATYCAPDNKMLVIDVETEEHDTYYLPGDCNGLAGAASVHAFNLCGQLCVAIRISGRRRVNFWVMLSLHGKHNKWRTPDWERRYTFYLDAGDEYEDKPCCAWLDGRDGMLCYRFGDRLYKYNTTRKRNKLRIQLPAIPFARPDDPQQWNVYGGYRPSLLSPHLAFGSTSLLQQQRN